MYSSVKRPTGFSLTELVVAVAVAMVLMAVGLPAFLRAYHAYQLSSATTQVADILRLTRYEAIRQNTPIQCLIRASGSNPPTTALWVDSIPNLTQDPTEKTFLLGTSGNLVSSGSVPNTSGLISSANLGSVPVNTPSPTSSAVEFDARGAVMPPTFVNAFYLSSQTSPDAGYRAVLLMPAGAIQIWTADASGNWQQLR